MPNTPSLLVLLALTWVLSVSCSTSANAPSSTPTAPVQRPSLQPAVRVLPLHRRRPSAQTADEWGKWAKAHREHMERKYGANATMTKRGAGGNLLINQNQDSSFFGSLAIGTPPVSYYVILDTGSSDLWVADSNCIINCNDVPTFHSSKSSTFNATGVPFHITYGSGEAAGTLGTDVVQMAGFSVMNQTLALCDRVSDGLLNPPVSGLLGLGWKSISTTKAVPFWQSLAGAGVWDEPVMAFHLTRFVNETQAKTLEPGGTFTMGSTNSSLYTGEIEYINLVGTPSYWVIPLTSLTVGGASIPAPVGSKSYSAIDTGTTLVGGPPEYIEAIYGQIPGSAPGTGNFKGYYTYPCSQTANITVSFGGRTWPISEDDFKLTQLTNSECLGAFFQLTTGHSAPSWIVGDTFLKNVYSVFRYKPPSVGFAELSKQAVAQNGKIGQLPSPTIGMSAATVTAGTPTSVSSALGQRLPQSVTMGMSVAGMVIGFLL